MNRSELLSMYRKNLNKIFYHMVAKLVVVKEDEFGEYEVVFSVPLKYAMEYFGMTFDELENFLDNEYTSEDSEGLLEKAYEDGQLLSIY